jgi:hypothetical protein
MKSPFVLTLAAVLGVVVAMGLFSHGLLVFSCGEDVLVEQTSPGGTFVFVLHRRNCGATSGYATVLSVRYATSDFDPSSRDDVLVIDGDVSVTASWIDNNRLKVAVPKSADIFRGEQSWNGVAISYVSH